MVVTGRLTIPTADGVLLHYSAVASEPLESASKAPAAEVAASSCLRRAAALAGLGLELWGRMRRVSCNQYKAGKQRTVPTKISMTLLITRRA